MEDMKEKKGSVSITIDDSVLIQIRRLADRADRSLSSYINLVLKAHLEDVEKKTPFVSQYH